MISGLSSRVGTRRSVQETALGKALTAFLPASEYERVLRGVVFQRMTAMTITNMIQLRVELDKVRRQGYAVDNEEALLGCRCVSAPILNNDKVAVAALSISGPVTRVSPTQVPVFAGLLKTAADSVSTTMGFTSRRHPGNPKPYKSSAFDRPASFLSFSFQYVKLQA